MQSDFHIVHTTFFARVCGGNVCAGNACDLLLPLFIAGMDPIARRFMWDIISRMTTTDRECSVILTTHSMEEAESLCNNIGIMVSTDNTQHTRRLLVMLTTSYRLVLVLHKSDVLKKFSPRPPPSGGPGCAACCCQHRYCRHASDLMSTTFTVVYAIATLICNCLG